ncbi:unnamed protein product [Brassicogethes aeneus]|uniref:Uncharacterized protein n=1 Tax=Brassicogethes aeneus TaxID=1431903 RepID=A0A9P0B0J9_BRAAE|nr:unnamed protein product [Brassicogethes aeneus]
MMTRCICEKTLGKIKVKLQCHCCKKWAHQEYTGVLSNWTCAECEEEASSTEDDADSKNEAVDSSGSEPKAVTKIKNKRSTSQKKFTLNDVMIKLEKI